MKKKSLRQEWMEVFGLFILLLIVLAGATMCLQHLTNVNAELCSSSTEVLNLPSRYTLWDGCRVRLPSGEFVDPFNYFPEKHLREYII
jgi:hypothetical protein